MELLDSYTVIVTDKVRECRDFYRDWFGFEVAFEADWFVLVQSTGARPASLAFMRTDHPSSPPSPAAHRGDGSFVTFQVADAAVEHERVTAAGLKCDLPLTEEAWGQRRFGVVDPAGVWVDVVEQIEPAEGWWDPYLTGGNDSA